MDTKLRDRRAKKGTAAPREVVAASSLAALGESLALARIARTQALRGRDLTAEERKDVAGLSQNEASWCETIAEPEALVRHAPAWDGWSRIDATVSFN